MFYLGGVLYQNLPRENSARRVFRRDQKKLVFSRVSLRWEDSCRMNSQSSEHFDKMFEASQNPNIVFKKVIDNELLWHPWQRNIFRRSLHDKEVFICWLSETECSFVWVRCQTCLYTEKVRMIWYRLLPVLSTKLSDMVNIIFFFSDRSDGTF